MEIDVPQDLALALKDILDRSNIQTVSDHGRDRLFVHTDNGMTDVTKKPLSRSHEFLDLSTLISYARSDGNEKTSAVFYNDQLVELILDEVWMENRSRFKLAHSQAVSRWLDSSYDQADFIDLITAWSTEILSIGGKTDHIDNLLLSLQTLQLAANITYDSKYLDRNNIRVAFEMSEPNSGNYTLFPKDWVLRIPIFEGFAAVDCPCRMVMSIPKEVGQKPVFNLECPTFDCLRDQQIKMVGEELVKHLPGWRIIHGTAWK